MPISAEPAPHSMWRPPATYAHSSAPPARPRVQTLAQSRWMFLGCNSANCRNLTADRTCLAQRIKVRNHLDQAAADMTRIIRPSEFKCVDRWLQVDSLKKTARRSTKWAWVRGPSIYATSSACLCSHPFGAEMRRITATARLALEVKIPRRSGDDFRRRAAIRDVVGLWATNEG